MIKTLLLFTIIFISACNTNDNKKSENEQLVAQYFAHFNKHDWEKMAGMYAENTACKDPSLGQGIVNQTRQQFIDKYTALHTIFPNLKDSIVTTYTAEENNIIVEFISSGTAVDSTKFELPICTIFTIENGLITKDFTYFDNFEESK